MKIAIIGASGRVGSRVATEALSRQHQVTGIARHSDKIEAANGLKAVEGDISDPAALARVMEGHDAVVSAVRFQGLDVAALLDAVKRSGVKRLVMVGGAGSLKTPDGKALLESPQFPDAFRAEATAGAAALKALAQQKDVEWTYLSPSALFEPGERTGKFRVGNDDLLTGADGNSRISMEDYAIALVDELEKPAHVNQRFTVGY